jgi:uncharacterized membrane protein
MLMHLLNISWTTPWLLISIILYVFAGLLWLVAVYLQIRMKDIALLTQKEKGSLGQDYFRLVNYWILLGFFSFLAMASVFVLMVFKP